MPSLEDVLTALYLKFLDQTIDQAVPLDAAFVERFKEFLEAEDEPDLDAPLEADDD